MSALITAVSVQANGAHPAAWREHGTDVVASFDGEYWARTVQQAEAAGLDFVTLPDSLAPSGGPGELRQRLDAVAVLARVAPVTDRIGLVPTVTTTHTEPFHLQAAIASLDFVSQGRAGWQLDVSATAADAAVVGRRPVAAPSALWAEAAEVADVGRLLWDSWEDDAEIRDAVSGRFVDRDKLHYVDFRGEHFSIKGPSIVPRPPQGHPVTVVALTGPESLPAAAGADVVLVGTADPAEFAAIRAGVLDAVARRDRDPADVRVLADLTVLLEQDPGTAHTRRERLDSRAHRTVPLHHAGTVDALVGTITALADHGADGVHLRPAAVQDLTAVTDLVLPAVRSAGLVGDPPSDRRTLRERLGLSRPANLFAAPRGA